MLVCHRLPKRCSPGLLLNRRFLTTTILTVGKPNSAEEFVIAGCKEYEKRLKSTMTIVTHFVKNNDQLVSSLQKNVTKKGVVIALDENGSQHSSRDFSNLLHSSFENGGSHVLFVIGGPEGLPPEIKNKYPLFSLSKLTWTYQMSRLLLLEQIYRAVEIRKNSSYHKD